MNYPKRRDYRFNANYQKDYRKWSKENKERIARLEMPLLWIGGK